MIASRFSMRGDSSPVRRIPFLDTASSVVGAVPAGCNPVRLVTAPNGSVAYVSARGDDALLAFETKKLLADPTHALIATVPVGTAPVGVAVIEGGRKVVVTNS